MVQSQIKSEIHYPEIRTIDVADQGQAVDAFIIEIHHHNYLVAIGKEKYDFSTKHRVVFPHLSIILGHFRSQSKNRGPGI